MVQPSVDAIQQVWWTTLAIYVVVLAVVAFLLTMILRETRRIRAGVGEIWTAGQRIANNTIHIALLDTTNHVVKRILTSAGGVAGATAAIRTHAERCPGCPDCVLKRGGRR